MRKLGLAVAVAALVAVPGLARAGWLLEGSIGVPFQTNDLAPVGPGSGRLATNVMLAPGYSFLDDIFALELGLVANLGDVERDDFHIGLRPSLKVAPPIIPLYGRVILDVSKLGSGGTTSFGFGGGFSFGVAMIHLFIEADYIPRTVTVGTVDVTQKILEGRAGVELSL